MSSSVGMMTFPIYGKIKNGPNHQPDILCIDDDLVIYNYILYTMVDLPAMFHRGSWQMSLIHHAVKRPNFVKWVRLYCAPKTRGSSPAFLFQSPFWVTLFTKTKAAFRSTQQ